MSYEATDLLAVSTSEAVKRLGGHDIWVSGIDADLSDTAACCEHYEIGMDTSANCIIVEAKRADRIWYAACLVLAKDRADVNGAVRRELDARKISFAPIDVATSLSRMDTVALRPLVCQGTGQS